MKEHCKREMYAEQLPFGRKLSSLTNMLCVRVGSLPCLRKCNSIVLRRTGRPPPLHSEQGHLYLPRSRSSARLLSNEFRVDATSRPPRCCASSIALIDDKSLLLHKVQTSERQRTRILGLSNPNVVEERCLRTWRRRGTVASCSL